jgi:hypothetical protein
MFLFFEKQGRLAAVLQLIFLKIRFSAIAQFFFLQQVKFNRRRLSIVQTGRFYAKNKTFSFTIPSSARKLLIVQHGARLPDQEEKENEHASKKYFFRRRLQFTIDRVPLWPSISFNRKTETDCEINEGKSYRFYKHITVLDIILPLWPGTVPLKNSYTTT